MEKYPKLKEAEECAYPERDDCNYGDNYKRCPYMKFDNTKSIFSSERWHCIYKKPIKSDKKKDKLTQEKK